ncbi:helix-turn-helix domain-containing protein [Streptomyces sp. NRRL S-350]|uniref:helix-turn-helix domain-containing protein n=1 Tax=Streptomyces sp. NRRL S-350 TaxID=1463902 RepID=UPI00131CDE7E|nr:helix-turn-helix transcriptional regulator [Streptomyces sp. NRRL S-350]
MPEGTGELKEAGEVARLLQELKSRSGLSYGALAKRLHVSTSALHRYCNGDVMPVEFAPLERLARLCRATPEERTELYRLWVVAHAARTNRQAPAPAPEAKTSSAAAVARTVPDTPAAPEPEETPSETREETREETPATAGAAGAGTAAPGRAPAVPPQRRLSRGALAAVTAAAVLATIGAVATGLKTHSGGPPASAPARTADTAPSTASPATASAATPVGTGATPSGPTDAADQGANAPISVTVRPSRWDTECDQYVVNRPPSEVPRPPAVVDVPAWVSRVGAVAGHYQSIELTVQGTGSETVVLTALNVRVARIAAPLPWNAYSMGDGCGGGVDVRSFDLDLDAARPRPVVTGGSIGLPVKVSERDPEVIEVTAETTSHDVSWYLELDWTSGNSKGIGGPAGAPPPFQQ